MVPTSWQNQPVLAAACAAVLTFGALPSNAVSETQLIQQGDQWLMQDDDRFYRVDPDVVSVKFRATVPSAARVAVLSGYEVVRSNRLGIMDIRVPPGRSAVDIMEELDRSGLFEFVEVNTIGDYIKLPNDPRFHEQWGLRNIGQTGGTSGADINAPAAWDLTTGNRDVVMAVADSGTEFDHPDLECNIWVNPGEDLDGDGVVFDVPDDINGLDDDGNGFVDDLIGWNFSSNDNVPDGTFYHGTHVAGIVGACGNNARGITGVAGGFASASPGGRMMPLNVGNSAPLGSVLDDAILYAADNGARIVTLSLSVGPSTAIDLAIEDAYDNGVFINNASGNSNSSVEYPANHPDVVAVGATDANDRRAGFSNYGPELELVAPGVNILSTQLNGSYGTSSGTSFASPHVAGTASLMFGIAPSATNREVRECLHQSAEDQVGNPTEDIPGRDNFYGWGRIDAAAALACIGGVPQVCNLDVDWSFDGGPGIGSLKFVVGPNDTATQLQIWLVLYGQAFPLVGPFSLPPLPSAVAVPPIEFPLTALGSVGVLATLHNDSDGLLCSDWVVAP